MSLVKVEYPGFPFVLHYSMDIVCPPVLPIMACGPMDISYMVPVEPSCVPPVASRTTVLVLALDPVSLNTAIIFA